MWWALCWRNHGIRRLFFPMPCVWSGPHRNTWFQIRWSLSAVADSCQRFWERQWHGIILAGLPIKGLYWKLFHDSYCLFLLLSFFLKTQQWHVSTWQRKFNLHFFDGVRIRFRSLTHLRLKSPGESQEWQQQNQKCGHLFDNWYLFIINRLLSPIWSSRKVDSYFFLNIGKVTPGERKHYGYERVHRNVK